MRNLTTSLKSAMVGLIIASSAAFGATPSVTVGNGAGQPNTAVTIDVAFENTTGGAVVGFQFDIQFNSTNLTADISDCGAGLSAITCSQPSAGLVRVLGDGALAAIASGSLGTIDFTIANNSALIGTTEDLTLANAIFSDSGGGSVTAGTLTNGQITVQAAPAPALSVSPTTGTFTAANGSTDTKSFTVTNSGNAGGLTVTNAALSGTNASNYSIASNTCPTSAPGVAQGATCTIQVTFTANAVSTFNASLDLTSNGGNESVALSGIGTLGPAGEITITPAGPFDFGDVLTGVDTGTQIFTVTNTGAVGSVVTISTAELNTSGAPYSITTNTCLALASVQLEKDETCAVTVEFEPTTDGVQTRTLTVSGTDGNATAQSDFVAMTGEGVTEPRPTSDPEAGSTQSQVVGPQGDHDFTVVFGNDGNAPYDISCGLDEGDTDIWDVANGAITTVAPGGTHTVTTTCSLPDTETYTATLSCSYGGREFEINLPTFTYSYECVGLPPLPIPVNNQWALVLLTLMLLMAAGFGFRFIARQ